MPAWVPTNTWPAAAVAVLQGIVAVKNVGEEIAEPQCVDIDAARKGAACVLVRFYVFVGLQSPRYKSRAVCWVT